MYLRRSQLTGLKTVDPTMVVRGWINVSPTLATILGSHNVTSFSRTSTGKFVLTWSLALVASAYQQIVAVTVTDNASTVTHAGYDKTAAAEPLQTTSANLLVESGTTDAVADVQLLTAIIMGPQ